MASRFQVSPTSEHQAAVIEAWAKLEGRSASNLCAMLLEFGLRYTETQGLMPQPIADRLRFRQ